MNNFDGLHALNDEAILTQLDNSDFEDLLDDDNDDIDPTYQPDDHSPDEDDAPDETHEDDPSLDADVAPGTSTSTNQGNTSKAKPHSWRKQAFSTKDDPIENYVNTVPQDFSPAYYFEKYFTPMLFESFAFFTNQYFQQQNGKPMNPPCTAAEIKAFFGIHGLIGIFKYPTVRMYWGTRFQFKEISDCMSRDRFFCLRVNLHCVDNLGIDEAAQKANRLWKVQPVISAVRERCLQLERGAGCYSIDEQMIPFLGSCPVRQVVKNKPRPVGLKNYVITSSNGLMLDFEILQGESTPFPDKSLGHGPAVVLRLVQTLPEGSSVYFDRYFTTLPLLEKLSEIKIEGTGTIQPNRVSKKDHQFRNVDLSKQRQNQMKRGEYDEYTRDDQKMALVMWKDNKAILMGSTTSGAEPITDVKRWDKKQKKYVDVRCPSVVKKYNSNMGGVDVLDQMMEYYRSFICTKKWPLKVILHFLISQL